MGAQCGRMGAHWGAVGVHCGVVGAQWGAVGVHWGAVGARGGAASYPCRAVCFAGTGRTLSSVQIYAKIQKAEISHVTNALLASI